ncbi:hypothetical protein AHAS_Ahas20G0320500 [Arachis hypogaea]
MMVFLPLPLNGWSFDYYLSNKVIYDLLPKLKQLRVLSLSHYKNISELPDSVGALKHLRHLDLSGTNIKRLPSVVCKLYNLQSLLLSDCKFLTELPEEIAMLVNLRHLDLSGTQLQEIPAQIARLENLQTLSGFVVSRQQNGLKVGELQKFPNLQGKLCISKLEKIVDSCDASQANMKKKEQIEDLSLEWDSCTGQESQHLVLEHLQPSTNLNKPTIKFYGGTWFPNWLDNRNIINASNLFSELMLGLNSLEQLHIEGIPSRTAIPRDGLPETLKSSVLQKL